MVTIQKYKDKNIKWIEKLIATAGLESYEISDAIREMAKAYPDLKDWAEKMSTWRDSIRDANSLDAVDVYYNGYVNLINDLMKKKHEEQKQEWKDNSQKNKEWWDDYYKKEQANKEWLRKYLAGELDWQKDQKKRDEENKKKLDEYKENLKKDDKEFDEKNKKSYIADIEMDLIKKNVSGEQLSQKLGVSDWRAKINEASDSWEALSRRSDLWDIIRELKTSNDSEFTCASCGEKKTEYYRWPLEGGKKYCSAECWNKGEGQNSPASRRGEFGVSDINEFFAWMKKMGVVELKFDFDNNQVVVKCDNGKKINITEGGLSTKQQQELTEQLKSTGEAITFSQVQSELGKNNKNGNGGIIATILIAGVLFAVIIGVVVYKNKKRDY